MTEGKDEKLRRKFRILVAPLDWGLGHATRCIPIIKELLGNDCDVWLAGRRSSGRLTAIRIFRTCRFYRLPATILNTQEPPEAFC